MEIPMVLVYNIFSVAFLGAKLASLEWPEPLERPTWLLEKLQKKYCILKSSEFNFQEDKQSYKWALYAPPVPALAQTWHFQGCFLMEGF